jgi:hypothetical protein
MDTCIDGLLPEELAVLARIRLAVTAHLVALAGSADEELKKLYQGRAFCLCLSAPRLPRAYIYSDGERLSAYTGGGKPETGLRSLTLRFTSVRSCVSMLSGSGGSVIPVPTGKGAGTALAFFKKAAVRAPQILGDPEASKDLKARLLTAAALHGLSQAALDHGLEDRLSHVPDGKAAIETDGAFSFTLEKRGFSIGIENRAPEDPQARLVFRDPEAAIAVLSGKRQAVVALGSGEVRIHGLLPLVQGLFAVLDKLGEYLAVQSAHGGTK